MLTTFLKSFINILDASKKWGDYGMKNMKWLHMTSYMLLWAGGLNWGLVGFFNFDLVEALFGMGLAKYVYMLVGLATLYVASTHMGECKVCSKK